VNDGPLLALRDVSFGYSPDRTVFHGVSMALGAGEKVVLAGRNGAGKTTLLHLLVGLLRPRSGEVVAFGRSCRGEDDFAAVRRRAALLFQDSEDQLFCPTVVEDVAFGPLNLGLAPAEALACAREALAVVGMAAFEDRVTHHLSVGEKKRVAMASILSMKPDVLLLDEPTAGLDDEAVNLVAGLVRSLPCAMLIVSQDRAFLDRIACRTLTLSADGLRATSATAPPGAG
jgi:cobalt/nickel transport system ATP-binding protein